MADVKSSLKVLLRAAKRLYPGGFERREKRDQIAEFRTEFKNKNREVAESNAFPMMPERILADLRKILPANAIITTDVGWNKMVLANNFQF